MRHLIHSPLLQKLVSGTWPWCFSVSPLYEAFTLPAFWSLYSSSCISDLLGSPSLSLRSPLWHASIPSETFLFSSVRYHCQFSLLFPQALPRETWPLRKAVAAQSPGSSLSQCHPGLPHTLATGVWESALSSTELPTLTHCSFQGCPGAFRDAPVFSQSFPTDATDMQRPRLASEQCVEMFFCFVW